MVVVYKTCASYIYGAYTALIFLGSQHLRYVYGGQVVRPRF